MKSSGHSVLAAYSNPLLLRIFVNGIISGLPWVLVGSAVTLWLQEAGYQRSQIGLFGIITLAYALNIVWAPLIDRWQIPLLGNYLGHRRAWIFCMSMLIVLLAAGIGFLDLSQKGHLGLLVAMSLGIALAGATQDIAIDAQRIEFFADSQPAGLAAGAAVAAVGWWCGYGFGGAFALSLSQFLESIYPGHHWQLTYQCLALLLLACIWLLSIGKPQSYSMARSSSEVGGLRGIYLAPVKSFIQRYGVRLALTLIAIILLFKVGEAFLGRMSLLFYREIGFSKGDIALYSKGFGTLAYCLFALFGGMVSVRYGLLVGLLIGGTAMAVTNLLFAGLYFYPEKWLFAFAVVADQFTTAVSTVAFVAFISQLCDRAHTAVHYAALASLGNLSRTTLAASSGLLIDGLGGDWALFFVLTAVMALPALLLIVSVRSALRRIFGNITVGVLSAGK